MANLLRLLRLPEEVRADLASGALSMGHARAILGLADAAAQRHAAREVISAGPVGPRRGGARQETRLGRIDTSAGTAGAAPPEPDVHTRAAEDRMRFALGTKVRIVRAGSGAQSRSNLRPKPSSTASTNTSSASK